MYVRGWSVYRNVTCDFWEDVPSRKPLNLVTTLPVSLHRADANIPQCSSFASIEIRRAR